jgi:histidyl-tRNA synthetase
LRKEVFRLIDRRDKMAPTEWEAFGLEIGLTASWLEGLKTILADELLWRKSDGMQKFFAYLEALGVGAYVRYAPQIVRGLDYYTGTVFEAWDRASEFRAILGGGRYDNLVGMFLGRDVPACGFSLGLERIIVVMTERGMFPAKVSRGAVDVMIACLDDEAQPEALALAAELRGERLRVDIYPEVGRKLEKPLKYAGGRGVPVLAILGGDERATGEVTVRDLQTREQERAPRATAASWIAKRVRIDP